MQVLHHRLIDDALSLEPGDARFGASLSSGIWKPQKTPWKIGGKHVENIRILILRHMVKIGRRHFRV